MASTTAPWESKRPLRRGLLRRIVTWLIVLGALTLIGIGLRPRPTEVEIEKAKLGPLTVFITEEGKTRIRQRYIVSAPMAGQMQRITLRAGDEVKANQTPLTQIAPASPALLDPRARAQAEARVRTAAAARQQAEQSLTMARTADKFAQANWTRVQALNDKGGLSITDRDAAERDAQMRAQEVSTHEFAVKVAAYEVEQAKAALVQATSDTPTTVPVLSPIDGRVLRVMQESAAVIATGTPLIEIGDPTDIEIEAEILSRDAIAIPPKAKVTIEQWGGPEALSAIVTRIEPAAFTKVSALGVEEQRVVVRSELVDPPPAARALGDRFRVEAKIAIWSSPSTLLVPAGALYREGQQWKTFVFNEGKAIATNVSVGRTDGRLTEILSGITEGTNVLLHPPDNVKNGSPVVPRAAH